VQTKAAVRKKAEQFSSAYMELYPLIYSSVLARIGNRDDADDICQEIFVIFYDKFDTIQNRRTWLFGTMKNVLLNHYRKKNRTVNIDDDFDGIGHTFTNGFRDTRILLQEAIENVECSEEDRVILDLVATFNFTYAHVAGLLGRTRRQVEYRYGTLVKSIQDYLEKKGIKDIAELL
jgi:RNA polymerase sigma-70 factor, ECF subfamily